eukprot:6179016-Pleurochrysis_carterae.AAC.2
MAIIMVPLVLVIITPACLSRIGNRCIWRDEDVRNTHPPSALLQSIDAARETLVHPDVNSGTGIDPPMFFCGAGLLPLDCGLTGLITVTFINVAAFLVIFFAMLNSPKPCTTGLGECRTISCMCGNVYNEGYVFMFCSLSLTSYGRPPALSDLTEHVHESECLRFTLSSFFKADA